MIKFGLNRLMASGFISDIKIKGLKATEIIEHVKAELVLAFLIVEMRPISFYLGLKIE